MLTFFLACAGTCLFAFLLVKSVKEPVAKAPIRAPHWAVTPESIKQFEPASYERTVYPYSVIPGGVRDREELVSSIDADPVVAAHYANFEVGKAQFIKSGKPQVVHVAYRIRDKVYWTAKTIKIPEGETLVSDGSNLSRARCGNRISDSPQEPVSEEEPPIETLETPMIARVDGPNLDISQQPELDLEPRTIDPPAPYFPPQPPQVATSRPDPDPPFVVFPPPHPFIEIPEPGTLLLLAAGLIAVSFAVWFTWKKKK